MNPKLSSKNKIEVEKSEEVIVRVCLIRNSIQIYYSCPNPFVGLMDSDELSTCGNNLQKIPEGLLQDWMKNLPEQVKQLPLASLAIPGSHDSAAYYLDKKLPLHPFHHNLFVRTLTSLPFARGFARKWAITQNLTIKRQLEHGIRYFDFRVVVCPVTGNFRFCHALYGKEIGQDLEDIAQFAANHPQEVLLLDFNHLYGFANEEKFEQLITIVTSYFPGKIWSIEDSEKTKIETITISEILAKNRQILLFAKLLFNKTFPQVLPTKVLRSYWPNKNKKESVNQFNFNTLKSKDVNQMSVIQCIMTPRMENVISPRNRSLYRYEKKLMQDLPEWLDKTRSSGLKPNIIIADFIGENTFVANVIAYNER
ncbi:PI-PLC X domain-containing protein 2-like isoform X3 [Symsagittifera roscoffensis]|uniref:PI-PLC X domain-containing protein 2-like isoform X3 n=2 Tax=Symsagittifera roscoffensis TaxID=84072 RepID=UPI00307B55C9